MTMKSSTLTTIIALAAIGAGGFMAGRISSPDASGTSPSGPTETRGSRTGPEISRETSAAADRNARRPGRPARGTSPISPENLARLTAIVRGEDPLDRNRALLAYIDQLGPGDFVAAVEHFHSLGLTESRMGEYALLLSAWAKMDPLAALDYAKTNTRGNFASSTILATWASRDPDAALRWAETNHQGTGPNPYLAGVIRGIAETNPHHATELLTSMPRSRERGDALDGMLPHLLAQGVDAARSWIEGLTDESLRNGAIMRAADNMAAIDPAGTAAWLLENPGEAAQRRMDDVYSQWARMDEQAALNAIAALPGGDYRSNAMRGVISAIATSDPATALSVLDRYPEDATDRVVGNFLWNAVGNDPGLAVAQVSRMSDAGRREWWYGHTLETWFNRDAAAASAWIRANPLPQSVYDRFASRLGGQ